ncbi:hypothetical protein M569_04851, partial [Genlisea aurea]
MGGSKVQFNKAHKTRFASKSSRNIHKLSTKDKKISKPDRNVLKGAKAVRLQRNRMMREQKKAAVLKEKRAISGSLSPPRIIVLFGLSGSVNLNTLEDDILSLLHGDENCPSYSSPFPTIASAKYKLRATVMKAPHGDLLACMEMAKLADLIAFVASPNGFSEDNDADRCIDSFGLQCLSVFRTLGLPSTVVLIRDLPDDLKRKNELKKMCMSMLSSEFPEDIKYYPADKIDELHKFLSLFKDQRITLPHWRQERCYLVAEKIDDIPDIRDSETHTVVLSGYIREHHLSVNQLVHISGAGDFQLSKIEILSDPCLLNAEKRVDVMDTENSTQVVRVLTPDPLKQEDLIFENVPDLLAGEQTWPTEAEMADAERDREKKKKLKKVLQGVSEYQAAWIVDDSDVENSDSDEGESDGMVLDDEEINFPGQKSDGNSEFDHDGASLNLRDSDEETETCSMTTEDDNLTKEQMKEQIQKIKDQHSDDKEFPDEVDTPLDVAARKRFAKYRGVKSFRTSTWDPKESLPPDYARIFSFDNFTRTQKHVLARVRDSEKDIDECVPAGSYAKLYVKGLKVDVASKLRASAERAPVIASGLLQHESKISVLHFSVRKHETYDEPIKSKEEFIFHVGFRQFISRPVFSSDSVNSNKHKMERFLHEGCFSVASIYAPICFPSLPLVALKCRPDSSDAPPVIAAVGSLRSVDPDRIVLKKIILTGYPQRVSKSKARVRYMFHNREDVKWFKPVELWTKHGRRGRIKEPVGTH